MWNETDTSHLALQLVGGSSLESKVVQFPFIFLILDNNNVGSLCVPKYMTECT